MSLTYLWLMLNIWYWIQVERRVDINETFMSNVILYNATSTCRLSHHFIVTKYATAPSAGHIIWDLCRDNLQPSCAQCVLVMFMPILLGSFVYKFYFYWLTYIQYVFTNVVYNTKGKVPDMYSILFQVKTLSRCLICLDGFTRTTTLL